MDDKKLSAASKLVSENKFEEAKKILVEAIPDVTESEDVEALKLLGLCYVNLEDTQKAITVFRRAIQLNAEDATSWYYLGTLYDNIDANDLAEQAYKTVISLRDTYQDAYKNLTLLLIKQQKLDEAKIWGQKTIELLPEDYQSYYILGTISVSEKRTEEGIEYFQKALQYSKDNSSILNSIGVAYFSMNKLDIAEEYLKQADMIEPHNAITNFHLGNIAQINRDYKKAFKYFQIAYTKEPTANHLATLAYCAIKAEKYDDAIVLYKTLTVMCPDKPNFQYNLACALIQKHKFSEAAPILKRLVAKNPKSATMAEKLASLYFAMGEYEDAKLVYQLLIKKGKISADTYFRYALICINTNDKDRAVQILKKVISLEPENAQAHKNLGVIYLSQRLFDYAKEEFELAVKYEPLSPQILFEYANFLFATADYQGAKPIYEKVLTLKNDNPEFSFYKGLNHLAINELAQAKESFELSRKIQKNDLNTYHLARANYYLNNFKEAKALINEMVEQDLDAQNILALSLYALKEYEEAIYIYKKMLSKVKNNVNLTLSLAKCYIKTGQKTEAEEFINKVLSQLPEHEEALELLKEAGEINV